ncbi:MAG: hypothetical protein GY862_22760 [Gammaproteobacteria bacterium]|nr:hypothetical protein [Gammaproteobacteria bacterium]
MAIQAQAVVETVTGGLEAADKALGLYKLAADGIADLHISITHDRNNTKKSCMKNSLSLVNGDELAEQSRSAGTGKKTREEINGTRGYPVFMAVAE